MKPAPYLVGDLIAVASHVVPCGSLGIVNLVYVCMFVWLYSVYAFAVLHAQTPVSEAESSTAPKARSNDYVEDFQTTTVPDMKTMQDVTCKEEKEDMNPYARLGELEALDLISFAYQISMGMVSYLACFFCFATESIDIIHVVPFKPCFVDYKGLTPIDFRSTWPAFPLYIVTSLAVTSLWMKTRY